MIVECKFILEDTIMTNTPIKNVAKSIIDEKEQLTLMEFPFASLITLPGKFDDRSRKIEKVFDSVTKKWLKYQVRGTRNLSLQIRIFTKAEEEASSLSYDIIRNIPIDFTLNDRQGKITIGEEEHSDHVTKVIDKYMSLIVVTFSVEVAADPVVIPTFTNTELENERK